ncbi:coiled-coil domain-containing protein 166-like [Protopterus annectens]|uniref:coiled-coil domain-containing protein 166-like n=1 Tax=Protopterus annectens TaxID=7888 RepID=UPI001CFB1B83|nr:coiled-coil domain-containing protein 166-like [Protopterus annectens]
MPPKKKKQTKQSAVGETAAEGVQQASATRESLLQREHDQLTEELSSLKKRIEELSKENDLLQEEALQTRVESQEYMTYMSKRTHKRQNAIITLSDQNQKELEDIEKQKNELLSHYMEKKKSLKNQLLEKENEFCQIQKEIDDLKPFKDLQAEQLSQIKDLEKEVIKMRVQHADNLQKIKSNFLHDKTYFEQDSQQKVLALAKEAHKEAIRCLFEHTEKVRSDNRQLRQELLGLIQKSRALREHQMKLEEQHQQLLRELQYSQDLVKLRTTRQHKILHSLVFSNKEEPQLANH